MVKPRARRSLPVALVAALALLVAQKGWAGSCASDISRLNAAMKDQYVPFSWSNMFYCAVARGSDLRKDALVTRAQISAIATDVSLALRLDRIGQEQDCKAALVTAKRLLRVQ